MRKFSIIYFVLIISSSILYSKPKYKVDSFKIFSDRTLDLNSLPVVLHYSHPYYVLGKDLYLIDTSSCGSIPSKLIDFFPKAYTINDIVSSNTGLFYCKDSVLLYKTNEFREVVEVFAFHKDDLKILSANEDNFYFELFRNNGIEILCYNLSKNNLNSILFTRKNISSFCSNNENQFFTSGNSIYLIKENTIIEFFTIDEPIINLAFTSKGIIFSTFNCLFLIDSSGDFIKIAETGATKLFASGNVVFTVNSEGEMFKLIINEQ